MTQTDRITQLEQALGEATTALRFYSEGQPLARDYAQRMADRIDALLEPKT